MHFARRCSNDSDRTRAKAASVDPDRTVAREMLATYRALLASGAREPRSDARRGSESPARTAAADLQSGGCRGHRRNGADSSARALRRRRLPLRCRDCTGPLRELMLWTRQDERAVQASSSARRRAHDARFPARRLREPRLGRLRHLRPARHRRAGRRATRCMPSCRATRSLDGEEFQVTFLGHETQHFADLDALSPMPQWELEYRAKLVELAKARLDARQGPAQIQRRPGRRSGVTACLRQQARAGGARATAAVCLKASPLDDVDVDRLQNEAAAELREDTWRRRATRSVSGAAARDAQADQ